jgi:anti-sigma regulatory factor (Ser/Thr protein kinase)
MIQTIRRELDVPVDVRSLAPLREFVREVLAASGLGVEAARPVTIAVDAVCTGIIVNAAARGATGKLQLLLDVDANRVKIRVSDTVNDYDGPGPSREELLQEFAQGRRRELGVFLLRRLVDELQITYRRGFQSDIELIRFVYAPPHEPITGEIPAP